MRALLVTFLLLPVMTMAEERVPNRLSETGLYVAGRPGEIDPRNRPFSPQYPLWTDGATKQRWIYLPPGTAIDATNVDEWNFPVGTRLWKEFALDNRKVETRLLWKVSPTRWAFASYKWNDEGTDALLAPDTGVPDVIELAPGRRYSIPSATDCVACHGAKREMPLGFNALQLSDDRDPNAIHGEPRAPSTLTVKTLMDDGRLSPPPIALAREPQRIKTSNPQTRAALGYLVGNCASCHNGNGEIAALGPILKRDELLRDGDAVASKLLGQRTKWQVPGVAEGASVVVDPTAPELSALLVRMKSRRPSSQMPPLGTVVRDQAAIDAIARWIGALTPSH